MPPVGPPGKRPDAQPDRSIRFVSVRNRYGPCVDFVHPIEAVAPGMQGQVLAVLTETTAELNLPVAVQLTKISPAQASRVLPGLVELDIVQ